MNDKQQTHELSNAHVIWDAVVELSNAERSISRTVLRDLTGLKVTIIDDHIGRLDAAGKLRKVGGGLMEVIKSFPPARPVSATETESGMVKFEIGDFCMDLVPTEARKAARVLGGYLHQLDDIDRSNKALIRTAELANQVRELRRELNAIKKYAASSAQLDLLADMPST